MLLKCVVATILFCASCFAGTCPKELGLAAKTQDVLQGVAYPHDWHFIIVCSDSDWQFLLRHFGEQRTRALAATSVINKTTWFKSDIFKTASGESSYPRVILHEIGHIRCLCKDEALADQIAREIAKQRAAANGTQSLGVKEEGTSAAAQ